MRTPHFNKDIWLSQVLGIDCFNLSDTDLSPKTGRDSAQKFLQQNINFSFAKVSTVDLSTVEQLEAIGFHVVDTSVVFQKPITEQAADPRLRLAKPEDKDTIVSVTSRSFRFSRFHLDRGIPDTLATQIKEKWVGNFFRGTRGDAMLVAEIDGTVVGFVLVLEQEDRAVIDLIAVDPEHQKKGIGRALIHYTEQHYFGTLQHLAVGTQIANTPSLNLYENLGFRIISSSYILHFHNNSLSGVR